MLLCAALLDTTPVLCYTVVVMMTPKDIEQFTESNWLPDLADTLSAYAGLVEQLAQAQVPIDAWRLVELAKSLRGLP